MKTRTLSSPVKAFVRDRCIVGPGREVSRKALYVEWSSWCLENGKQPGTEAGFGRDLKAAIPGLGRAQPRREGKRDRALRRH